MAERLHKVDRRKLKDKNWNLNRKVVLEPDLFYSDAFQSLSKSAMLAYMRFCQKRRWEKKSRRYIDELLIFTYDEAEALGLSETTFKRSIRELVEKGLMTIKHQGGFFGKGKDCSQYNFSDTWRLYGTNDFPNLKKTPLHSNGVLERHNQERVSIKIDKKRVTNHGQK